MSRVLSVSKDFSNFPIGRYRSDGPYSGEVFRAKLVNELKTLKNETLVIDLDGTEGYGSSFLDEAFGGLIREEGFTQEYLLKTIKFKVSPAREMYRLAIYKHWENAQEIKNKRV